jgi:hypothetical protein
MVLILDGEELVGAKQNRIVNITILVAAKTTTVIPVSCVDQGRWSYRSDKFSSEKRIMSPRLRSRKADQVKYSLKNLGNFRSDQSAIWDDVSELAFDLDAESPSMAMSEIYRKQAPTIEKYVKHFDLTDSQVGAVLRSTARWREWIALENQILFQKFLRNWLKAMPWMRSTHQRETGKKQKRAPKAMPLNFWTLPPVAAWKLTNPWGRAPTAVWTPINPPALPWPTKTGPCTCRCSPKPTKTVEISPAPE